MSAISTRRLCLGFSQPGNQVGYLSSSSFLGGEFPSFDPSRPLTGACLPSSPLPPGTSLNLKAAPPVFIFLWTLQPPLLAHPTLSRQSFKVSLWETLSSWDSPWPQLAGDQKPFLLGDSQPPQSPDIHRGPKRPKNKIICPTKITRYQHLKLQSSPIQMPRHQHKNAISDSQDNVSTTQ